VGWGPLGYRDRPALLYDRRDRGRAVLRGETAAAVNPWAFVRRADMGARDMSRRRVDGSVDLTRDVRMVDSSRIRLTREMQLGEVERAVPRNIRTKPGPGDTIPQLRSDPRYTIPAPLPRQQYESERERDAERRRPSPRNEERAPAERAVVPAPATERPVSPAPLGRSERIERAHPTDVRSAPAGTVAITRPRPEERTSPAGESPDREVMRPVFRPLGRSEGERERPASTPDRGEVRSGAERRRPESTPRAQPQGSPRAERPPEARPTPREQSPQEGAARRKKDN
jgi:hypothetical protein